MRRRLLRGCDGGGGGGGCGGGGGGVVVICFSFVGFWVFICSWVFACHFDFGFGLYFILIDFFFWFATTKSTKASCAAEGHYDIRALLLVNTSPYII